jgi:hypothetical protein
MVQAMHLNSSAQKLMVRQRSHVRHFSDDRWLAFFAAFLLLSFWASLGCEYSPVAHADGPVADGQLEIRPLPGMLDVVDIPVNDQLVGVYRCDFRARQLSSVGLKIHAVKQDELIELGEVSIDTGRLPNNELKGTFYIAFLSHGGDAGTITQLLSLGISTEFARKYSRVKDFKIPADLTFKTGATLQQALTAPADKEATIWGVCYSLPDKETRHKTVQELMADKGPFESMDSAKIIKAAKSMKDTVVIFATVSGTK